MELVLLFLAFPTLVAVAAFASLAGPMTSRLSRDLLDPAKREAAMARLRRWIDRHESTGELVRTYAADLVSITATLIHIGEARFAAEQLGKLDPSWMTAEVAKTAANNEALAWLDAGEIVAARGAVDKAPIRGTSSYDDLLDGTDALVLAFEGRYREALDKVDALSSRSYVALETIQEVRARAHAGLGEGEQATLLLREWSAANGPAVLESMVKRGGPGASLAKQILESRGTPYR